MKRIIAVINQKGGVGKTTVAFNLARGLADRGRRILAVDNDPQGNLTGCLLADPLTLTADILRIYQEEKINVSPQKITSALDLIGANIHLSKVSDGDLEIIFRLKEGLEQYRNEYDFIIIDCLPAFGYLNMAAINASDYLIIPVNPAPFALSGLADLFETIRKGKKRLNPDLQILGILINLVEGRRTNMGEELAALLQQDYGELTFKTVINKGIKIEESPAFQKSIMEYAPDSKNARQFNEFIDEFLMRIENE
ncbi:MAG: ParA family protein [Candidatus Cloacimonetes bacterium]|nr:ParA family protein [Candidatus Cloacimonadota bacterium]